MEKDDEVKGSGNSLDTYYRGFDPRTGRWLSIDPYIFPWESGYAGIANNPIALCDPLGNRIKYGSKKVKKEVKYLRKHNAAFNEKFKAWEAEYGKNQKRKNGEMRKDLTIESVTATKDASGNEISPTLGGANVQANSLTGKTDGMKDQYHVYYNVMAYQIYNGTAIEEFTYGTHTPGPSTTDIDVSVNADFINNEFKFDKWVNHNVIKSANVITVDLLPLNGH